MKKNLLFAVLILSLLSLSVLNASAAEYEPGYVFYNQEFKDIVTSISDAGLTLDPANNEKYKCEINQNGYIEVRAAGIGNPVYNKFILPDILPTDIGTYTVETKFRFIGNNNGDNGGFIIGFGYGTDNVQDCNLRYNTGGNGSGKFDKFGNTALIDVNDEWLVGENGYGKWITLKVSIKDYEITKATVIVEGNNPITVTGDKTKVGAGRLFIMQGYIDAEISSIKVVNGMDYTSYSGEYATKFYYNGETANTTESTDTSAQTSDSYIPMLIVGFLVSSVIAVALTVKRRIFVR